MNDLGHTCTGSTISEEDFDGVIMAIKQAVVLDLVLVVFLLQVHRRLAADRLSSGPRLVSWWLWRLVFCAEGDIAYKARSWKLACECEMRDARMLTLPWSPDRYLGHKLPHLIVSVDFDCGDLLGEEKDEIP